MPQRTLFQRRDGPADGRLVPDSSATNVKFKWRTADSKKSRVCSDAARVGSAITSSYASIIYSAPKHLKWPRK